MATKKEEVKRCDICRGKKKVMGLGMLEKKCVACNGVGHIIIKESKTRDKNAGTHTANEEG